MNSSDLRSDISTRTSDRALWRRSEELTRDMSSGLCIRAPAYEHGIRTVVLTFFVVLEHFVAGSVMYGWHEHRT